MHKYFKILIYITLSSMFFIGCSPQYSGKVPPKVINGEIDLTGWDFEKDGPIKLDGEWLFAWEKFVEPASWQDLQKEMVHTLPVPGYWHIFKNPANAEHNLPATGYASYAIRLIGLKDRASLGIEVPNQTSASSAYWLTEEGIILQSKEAGLVARNQQFELPMSYSQTYLSQVELEYRDKESTLLLMQVSNHHYFKGGPQAAIQLGVLDKLKRKSISAGQLQDLMTGILLIMGLYHLVIFFQRKKDKAALYFGLFSLSFVLRIFSMGVAQRNGFFDSVSIWVLLSKLEYISMPFIVISYSLYLYTMLPEKLSNYIVRYGCITGIPLILLPLVTSPLVFPAYLSLFQLYLFIGIFLVISFLVFHSVQQKVLAFKLLLTFILVALGVINDILYNTGVLDTGYIGPYTTVLFLLLQAAAISSNNAKAYKQAEALSTRLSREVQEKDFLNQTSAVGKHNNIESAVQAFFGLVKQNFNINSLSYLKIDLDANQIKSVFFDHPIIEDPDFITFRDNFDYQLDKSIGSLYLTYIRKKPFYASKQVDVQKLKSKVDRLIVKVLKFGDFLHIPLVSEKETIGIVIACNYQGIMNLTRNEVKLLNSACQSLSGLFKAYSLNESLTKKVEHNKKLSQSNEELAEQKLKYSKMIGELSFEFAQAGEKLDAAKEEQAQIAKELKEASNQLIQAEKLSGLGAMVSGIAHDINNPLNFIETARFQEQEKLDQLKAHLLGLVPEGEEGEEFKADLLARFDKLGKLNEQIKTGVTRVTEISKSMRNASRADTEKTNDVNLVEVIEEALIITGNKIKQFQLINNIPDGIALATCNRSQIGQVVMNFLSNAADALVEYKEQSKDHKGAIQVDLAINNQNKDQNQQKTVQISVSDNGSGVPKENRDKVLNAFFTTKEAGVGTGLGLAIAGKVAQAHDGTIYIEDGLPNDQGGYGARFTLEFLG